jgi:hypothetical protein
VAKDVKAVHGGFAAAFRRLAACFAVLLLVALPRAAFADDKAKLFATTENGFARIIVDFPTRLDLPTYKLRSENGVLSIVFDSPVAFTVPDISAALPDYVSIARVDPDHTGIRFGLRSTFTVNTMVAGEQLFVDLLPTSWQGLPPGLPTQVVDDLAARAKEAAILAEQEQKAAEAKLSNPMATVAVGRNPTFMRVEFTWNVDTEAKFAFSGTTGTINFDWPVPIDLYLLKAGLPKELQSVDGQVSPAGSSVAFHVAPGVVPRFYQVSNEDFIVDIDTASTVPVSPDPMATATAQAVAVAEAETKPGAAASGDGGPVGWISQALDAFHDQAATPITPTVATIGSTIRITFPFGGDTPAAVFRRGDVVWMMFDTLSGINQPAFSKDLADLAKNFTIVPAGDAQVVRLDLSPQKLATLGSEGKSWVLSIGDMLLGPTAPLTLGRRFDKKGLGEVTADLGRPGHVHDFKDPIVGDDLRVVTAYPPARGIERDLSYVEFEALHSVQGLVVRPEDDSLTVALDGNDAVIGAPDGLTLSTPDAIQLAAGTTAKGAPRDGFIDLGGLVDPNPVSFGHKVESTMDAAAAADGAARDTARLDLARLYLANQYGPEAIGVLEVLEADLKTPDLKRDAELMLAVADVIAQRPGEALPILNSPMFANDIDAQMWRSIAETDAGNFDMARRDAIAVAPIVASYPAWVRTRFFLSGVRAAVETGDSAAAEEFDKAVAFADLDPEQVSLYRLLNGRIAETEGRTDEALDSYGQVIASDVRPTRAEAVYHTILLLDKTGKIDVPKAINTLAAEALLWRGDTLEANMDQLLATLYFRTGQYRLGFEASKSTVQNFPSLPAMAEMSSQAQGEFEGLFLDGKADKLPPVDALALFYDFRDLTPPGSDGDRMIRNLAERLVKVDLLGQAAELLKYQIDNRLKGAAKSDVAADLAIIDIANRAPEDALAVLTDTELEGLPPTLARRRRLLEAKALIDSHRIELALDILKDVTGRDADELRVEANWASKNYNAAGSLIEVMYSPGAGDRSAPQLSQTGQTDIVRAAVGYALDGDKIGLSRLRSKFSDGMADTPAWPMFNYITSTIDPINSPNFAKVAQSISSLDTLDAFLAAYKKVYGGGAGIAPEQAAGLAAGATPTASAG